MTLPPQLQRLHFGCHSRAFVKVKTLSCQLNTLSFESPEEFPEGCFGQILYQHPTRGICWLGGSILECSPTESGFRIRLGLQFSSLADQLPYQQLVLSWLDRSVRETSPGQVKTFLYRPLPLDDVTR